MEITGVSKSIDVERLTSKRSTLLGIGTRQYVKVIFYVDLNENRRKVKGVYVDVINIYDNHTSHGSYQIAHNNITMSLICRCYQCKYKYLISVLNKWTRSRRGCNLFNMRILIHLIHLFIHTYKERRQPLTIYMNLFLTQTSREGLYIYMVSIYSWRSPASTPTLICSSVSHAKQRRM